MQDGTVLEWWSAAHISRNQAHIYELPMPQAAVFYG